MNRQAIILQLDFWRHEVARCRKEYSALIFPGGDSPTDKSELAAIEDRHLIMKKDIRLLEALLADGATDGPGKVQSPVRRRI